MSRFANDAPLRWSPVPARWNRAATPSRLRVGSRRCAQASASGSSTKSSFDKANRTSLTGRRGLGLEAALPVFDALRRELDLPVLTDVHTAEQCAPVARSGGHPADPGFPLPPDRPADRRRRHGARVVNVKKGQFLAPWDMENVIAKVTGSGNDRVMVTERGVSFGYNTLVSDMRALADHGRVSGRR